MVTESQNHAISIQYPQTCEFPKLSSSNSSPPTDVLKISPPSPPIDVLHHCLPSPSSIPVDHHHPPSLSKSKSSPIAVQHQHPQFPLTTALLHSPLRLLCDNWPRRGLDQVEERRNVEKKTIGKKNKNGQGNLDPINTIFILVAFWNCYNLSFLEDFSCGFSLIGWIYSHFWVWSKYIMISECVQNLQGSKRC